FLSCFFFSSRRRHTRFSRDWSSDVCSSDLNEFGGQEPGTNQQIKNFCTTRFAVTFPMSEKIVVKGESRDPLYTYLTEQAGDVTWNFNKFLVDRTGKVVCRFDSKVEPLDPKLTKAIEAALG